MKYYTLLLLGILGCTSDNISSVKCNDNNQLTNKQFNGNIEKHKGYTLKILEDALLINIGDSKSSVIELLGDPQNIRIVTPKEFWRSESYLMTYSISDSINKPKDVRLLVYLDNNDRVIEIGIKSDTDAFIIIKVKQ